MVVIYCVWSDFQTSTLFALSSKFQHPSDTEVQSLAWACHELLDNSFSEKEKPRTAKETSVVVLPGGVQAWQGGRGKPGNGKHKNLYSNFSNQVTWDSLFLQKVCNFILSSNFCHTHFMLSNRSPRLPSWDSPVWLLGWRGAPLCSWHFWETFRTQPTQTGNLIVLVLHVQRRPAQH